ncbi:MAG: PVC-type heme-binding CxxCH protein [Pirellulales bacterium]
MTRPLSLLCLLAVGLLMGTGLAAGAMPAAGKEVSLNGHVWTLPDDFEIDLIASSPLVERPITADFDEQGRLYVTDSSGSNDKVAQQLIDKPHRVLCLEDTDGDGRFDKSTVFADKLMFPEGTLWHDGSLYVAAPPSIWKLTDTDGDGTADQREEWFQGQTLTGCANDLHGPYLGPDGYIYWCKGAFAEQTYQRPGKPPLVTKASHIFRCRPDAPRDPATGGIATSAIESVMTGGMDNPVDTVFTAEGDRIFTTTFLVHPGGGQRDGLIHAIYGGVYGKQHAVLDGHPRTGELMPPLVHLGAAAPCGLVCRESDRLGAEYRGNLFACCFNMHKVTRHQLADSGAMLQATSEDFLTSSNIDFHPTDIQEDADGSLIVCDTGGWYKLCCPTSQLWKPDVLGAIYRIRRKESQKPAELWRDPRGLKLSWSGLTTEALIALLGDARPAVRRRALLQLSRGDASVTAELAAALPTTKDVRHRQAIVWALTRMNAPQARQAVRLATADEDTRVRRTALHAVSLWRDSKAAPQLRGMLSGDTHEARIAAEALGRMGDVAAVPNLLNAATFDSSRAKEHALIYALIEIGDVSATADGLTHDRPAARRAALIALENIDPAGLQAESIAALLDSDHAELRETSAWIIGRHAEWGNDLAGYLRDRLHQTLSEEQAQAVTAQLAMFAQHEAIQGLLAETAASGSEANASRRLALQAMRRSALREMPATWSAALAATIDGEDPEMAGMAVGAARMLPAPKAETGPFNAALLKLAQNPDTPTELRLDALASLAGEPAPLAVELFAFVKANLLPDRAVRERAAALLVLGKSRLDEAQLQTLALSFRTVSPLEATRLLALFEQSRSAAVGQLLAAELRASPALTGLKADNVRHVLAKYGDDFLAQADELASAINIDEAQQKAQLESLLGQTSGGDIRRGLAVFHSTKAACLSCHQLGYLGQNVGPDISKIGKIRTERDLLEAIVFPSASFVRSYEPVVVTLVDGRVENGILKEDAPAEIVLAKNATDLLRIPRDEIEEIYPSQTSIMPAGFGKHLSTQDLADLVAFLKSLQ